MSEEPESNGGVPDLRHTLMALPSACNAYAKSADIDWHEAKPGVFVKHLLEAGGAGQRVSLARLAPGAYSPPHAHDVIEHIYVLEGEFDDGERVLSAGDYCVRAAGVTHKSSSEHGALVLSLYVSEHRAQDA